MEMTKEKKIYKARGGHFKGELSTYCSGDESGAYYWSASNSEARLRKLTGIVGFYLENPNASYHGGGDVASASLARAVAEISTFAEGVVPNIAEILEETANRVAEREPISLCDADAVVNTYDYLLGHNAVGVTQEQKDAFLEVAGSKLASIFDKRVKDVEVGIASGYLVEFFDNEDFTGKDAQTLYRLGMRIHGLVGETYLPKSRVEEQHQSLLKPYALAYLSCLSNVAKSVQDYMIDGLENKVMNSTYLGQALGNPQDRKEVEQAIADTRDIVHRARHPFATAVNDGMELLRAVVISVRDGVPLDRSADQSAPKIRPSARP